MRLGERFLARVEPRSGVAGRARNMIRARDTHVRRAGRPKHDYSRVLVARGAIVNATARRNFREGQVSTIEWRRRSVL
jgi:hypothetical protein